MLFIAFWVADKKAGIAIAVIGYILVTFPVIFYISKAVIAFLANLYDISSVALVIFYAVVYFIF